MCLVGVKWEMLEVETYVAYVQERVKSSFVQHSETSNGFPNFALTPTGIWSLDSALICYTIRSFIFCLENIVL